ncbi:MAG: Legume lectin domain [Gemmatimonadetes bacterium]|nr:Legume lectin domain [Gemmatimonadota bacterium]
MKITLRRTLAAALVLAGAACRDGSTPLSPVSNTATGPIASAAIVDAPHGAGGSFAFLPPMVPNPGDRGGAVDATLSPIVEICELNDAGNACLNVIHRFAATANGEHYQANWDAGKDAINLNHKYRASVYVDSYRIGYADVVVLSTKKDASSYDPNAFVVITSKETLPVKFRIGAGLPARLALSPLTPTIKSTATQQFTAVLYDLHGQPLSAATSWTSSNPAAATIDANGLASGVAGGVTTITASAGGLSVSTVLTVTQALPAIISGAIVPGTSSVGVFGSKQLTVSLHDQFGNVVTPGPITWSVSQPTKGLVDATGTFLGTEPAIQVVTAVVNGITLTAQVTVTRDLDYERFCQSDMGGLNLQNTTYATGPCRMRLTEARTNDLGTAWSKVKQDVRDGFETTFQFQTGGMGGYQDPLNPRLGADGIVFVLEDASGTEAGTFGVGIGYHGMHRAVAIEFDMWKNAGDLSDNEVGIMSGGTADVDATGTNCDFGHVNLDDYPGLIMKDGGVHSARIKYDATAKVITVWVDGIQVLVKPFNYDDPKFNGAPYDADGRAWVGFTSATGSAFQTHEIINWHFHAVNSAP